MSTIIIDGNSIGYAGLHSPALSYNGMETHAIFYTLKQIRKIATDYAGHRNILVLWDDRAEFRFDIYPEYKGNRSDDPKKREFKENYKRQAPYIEKALAALGVTQVRATGFEADDLAGFFVRRAAAKASKTLLITGDEDWMQLIDSPLVRWVDTRNDADKTCDFFGFEAMTGYASVDQFLQAKALQGDKSDNISGVGGLGEKAAETIMEEFGSIEAMIAAGPFGDKKPKKGEPDPLPASLSRYRKKMNEFIESGQPIYQRNLKLMNLRDATRDEQMAKACQVKRSVYDESAFTKLCEDLNFSSILMTLQNWTAPFRLAHE